MRILHVLSNFRWTERAEPAIDLAVAQKKQGMDIDFACGKNHCAETLDAIEGHALRKGIEPVYLELTKHFRIKSALKDIPELRALITEGEYDIIHCHMPNAHFLVSLAVRKLKKVPVIVSSIYRPDNMEWKMRFHFLSQRYCDGLIVIAPEILSCLTGKFRKHPEKVAVIEPGIEMERFASRDDVSPLCLENIDEKSFVAGMVTAIGQRRRLDLILGAIKELSDEYPQLRLMIVGRGKIEEFIEKPARELGIRDKVILAGYRRGDELVAAYKTMHVLTYAHPGTDKSCRTIREAMACGVPVIASRTGFLKNLVTDGHDGYLVDHSVEGMTDGIRKAISGRDKTRDLGRNAAQTAARRFSRDRQAEQVIRFYKQLLSQNKN